MDMTLCYMLCRANVQAQKPTKGLTARAAHPKKAQHLPHERLLLLFSAARGGRCEQTPTWHVQPTPLNTTQTPSVFAGNSALQHKVMWSAIPQPQMDPAALWQAILLQ
jgi:hypothetical protein